MNFNEALDFLVHSESFQTLAALASVISLIFYFYDKIVGFIKLKLTGTVDKDKLRLERQYLENFVLELKDLHRRTQIGFSNESYFHTGLKAEVKELTPVAIRYFVPSTKEQQISKPELSDMSLTDRLRSTKGFITRNLVRTLLKIKDHVVVILGDPGSGKSVSLRHLAISIARQERRWYKHEPIIPIYIQLGKYTQIQDSGDPEEIIRLIKQDLLSEREGGSYKSFIGENLDYYLKNGRFLFLFDAMDEMPRTDYLERYNKLKDFTDNWRQNRFVFSCRKLDYDKQFQVREIIIKQFDYSQISYFLGKVLNSRRSAKRYLKQISEKKPNIYELTSNPFFLRLISVFLRDNKRIPENQAQIFNGFIGEFISREKEKWMTSRSSWIGDDNLINILSRIAYIITERRGMGTIATEDFIFAHFDKDQRFIGLKTHVADVLELCKKSNLLDISEFNKTIQFQHHRLQEYFTALYLENYEAVIESKYYDDIWWQEIIKIYAGISSKTNSLLEKILSDTTNQLPEINGDLPYELRRLVIDRLVLVSICANISNVNIDDDINDKAMLLLSDFAKNGNTIEKIKALRGIAKFKTDQATKLIKNLLYDKSNWVSDVAFLEFVNRQLSLKTMIGLIFRLGWRLFWRKDVFSAFKKYSRVMVNSINSRSFAYSLSTSLLVFSISFNILKEVLSFLLIMGRATNPIHLIILIGLVVIAKRFGGLSFFQSLLCIIVYDLIVVGGFWISDSLEINQSYFQTFLIIISILVAISFVFSATRFIRIQINKRRFKKLHDINEQYVSFHKMLEIIKGGDSFYLKKTVIQTLLNSNIPGPDLISILTGMAEEVTDHKLSDFIWQSVEEVEKRQARKQFSGVDNKAIAGKFMDEGKTKLYQGEIEQAILNLDKAIELDENLAQAYHLRGSARAQLEQYDEAVEDFKHTIKKMPIAPLPYLAIAEIKMQQGIFMEALDYCNQAIKINARFAEAFGLRAQIQTQLGNFQDAIKDCQKALKINPEMKILKGIQGDAKHALGRFDDAIDDYTNVLNVYPDNAEALAKRGAAYMDKAEFVLSLNDLNKAISLEPENAFFLGLRAEAYIGTEEFDLAIADSSHIISSDETQVPPYVLRAQAQNRLGNFELAIEDCTKAIELNPQFVSAYGVRADSYRALGDHELAISDYSTLIELFPTDGSAYFFRGLAHSMAGNTNEACADFRVASKRGVQDALDFLNEYCR